MNADLQRATPADVAALSALITDAWPAEASHTEQIAYALTRPGHVTHLARVEGQPAGFVSSFITRPPDTPARWEIDLLAVAPPFRGHGLAGHLVDASVEAGHEHGAALARALTRVENDPIHHVFAGRGFHTHPRRYTLWVAGANPTEGARLPPGAYVVAVETLTYSGRWLEGQITPAALHAAVRLSIPNHLTVGCLLPVDAEGLHVVAWAAGYARLGRYQWWTRDLSPAPTSPPAPTDAG